MNPRSLRFRVPLNLVVAALTATLMVSLIIALETYFNLKDEQASQTRQLAHALTPTVTQSLKHDDVWDAYNALRGPPELTDQDMTQSTGYMLLLGANGQVFASNRPKQFPINERLDQDWPALDALASQAQQSGKPVSGNLGDRQVAAFPLIEDGVERGILLIASRSGAFWDRFLEVLSGGLIAVVAVVGLLLPLGWLLGRRLVTPLTTLAHCMERVGKEPVDSIQCPAYRGNDEVSDLATRFHHMLIDLQNKQALERQLMAQERLAAVGRLASGVAHEINNPLAGMLVAIDTYRQSPMEKRDAEKTLGFMERGLQQIRDTVGALLVECRFEQRTLAREDIDDLATLIKGNELARHVQFDWHNDLQTCSAIPAGPVRQVLLNLTLNALQAVAVGGTVSVSVGTRDGLLDIRVGDDGPAIPQEILEHIFEPFHSERPGGTGLGLWVTYETIRQLGGQIIVDSQPEWTLFEVQLPLDSEARTQPEAAA